MQGFEEYGFIQDDEKLEFKRIFNNGKFKEVYVDLYSDNPYALLLRANHKNVATFIKNDRLFVTKKDNTSAMNVLLDVIDKCMSMQYDNSRCTIIFRMFGLQYRILLLF